MKKRKTQSAREFIARFRNAFRAPELDRGLLGVSFMKITTTESARKISVYASYGFLGLMAFGTLFADLAPSHAVSYVKVCNNKDRGEWNFGSSPSGCDADQYGDPTRIQFIYPSYTFDRRNTERAHRIDYTNNMHALIKKLAVDYYRTREPRASSAEVAAWTRAVLTVSTQESYMSHYRIGPDGRYKLMTGDSQDSHGVMQVNQRYHAARGQDSSFDLVGNVMTGMEIYYTGWLRAKDSSCYVALSRERNVTQERLLEARARGAYSAYNGGPGSLCRYANGRAAWRRNDVGFLNKWNSQEWKYLVSEPNRRVELNTRCLIDGDDLCAVAEEHRGQYLRNRPIILGNGQTCMTEDGVALDCAPNLRTFACLARYTPSALDAEPVRIERPSRSMQITQHNDRNALCSDVVAGLISIGELIQVKKETRVRDEIGGRVSTTLRPGRTFQVLDYDVRLTERIERYYKIRIDARTEGWIYGGDDRDRDEWVVRVQDQSQAQIPIFIPRARTTVEIVKSGGVKLREAAAEDANELSVVVTGTRLSVESVTITSQSGEIWLRVRVGEQTGFIYAGRTYPTLTVSEWISIKR